MLRLLLGSVNHALKFERSEVVVCHPIPLEASCHIADHIQVSNFNINNRLSEGKMCNKMIFRFNIFSFLSR